MSTIPIPLRAVLPLCLALAPAAIAQTPEYELTPLGAFPGAHSTFATGMNDRGDVVGWAQFFGANPGIRAWSWTASGGFVLLPQTPGQSNYRAVDINNDGVIAGDGGYDSGFLWRYEGGTYTMLGAVPGDGRSFGYALNEAGEIAGTSWAFQLIVPKKAVLAAPGRPLQVLASPGEATAINEPGQVAGWGTGSGFFGAWRYTPGAGVQDLPPLGNNANHYPSAINNHGDVVGTATHANGNGGVPFLYTDAGGMQELGDFGGNAGAAGINDHGEVTGNLSSGGQYPWVWTAANGVRFLSTLVGPGSGLSLYSVTRINNRGQILARTYSSALGQFGSAFLTPIDPPQPGFAYCLGEDCPCGDDRLAGCANSTGTGARLGGTGSASVLADDLGFEAAGLPASQFGLVFAGPGVAALPFGDGWRCLGGNLVRFPVRQASAQGVLVESTGASGFLGAVAGDTWRFQCWYRDPAGCGADHFNASNGYEVTFAL
jgi:probable HAF family extracellular repeat protein